MDFFSMVLSSCRGDKAPAEETCAAIAVLIKNTSLTRGYSEFAICQLHGYASLGSVRKTCLARTLRRTHLNENLPLLRDGFFKGAATDPIDIAQAKQRCPKSGAAPDDDPTRGGIDSNHEKRLTGRDAQALSLSHSEIDDAIMRSEYASIGVHDLARFPAFRPQLANDRGVVAGGNEANILAVRLRRHGKFEFGRQGARFGLRQIAERKAQKIELFLCRCKQEIALVARRVGRLHHFPAPGALPALDVVTGYERGCSEVASSLQ